MPYYPPTVAAPGEPAAVAAQLQQQNRPARFGDDRDRYFDLFNPGSGGRGSNVDTVSYNDDDRIQAMRPPPPLEPQIAPPTATPEPVVGQQVAAAATNPAVDGDTAQLQQTLVGLRAMYSAKLEQEQVSAASTGSQPTTTSVRFTAPPSASVSPTVANTLIERLRGALARVRSQEKAKQEPEPKPKPEPSSVEAAATQHEQQQQPENINRLLALRTYLRSIEPQQP